MPVSNSLLWIFPIWLAGYILIKIILMVLDGILINKLNKNHPDIHTTYTNHFILSGLAVIGILGGVFMFIVTAIISEGAALKASYSLLLRFILMTIIEVLFVILFRFRDKYSHQANKNILIGHLVMSVLLVLIVITFLYKLFTESLW